METGETAETSEGAHQGDMKSERQMKTEGGKGDWRDCGGQWRCSPRG